MFFVKSRRPQCIYKRNLDVSACPFFICQGIISYHGPRIGYLIVIYGYKILEGRKYAVAKVS